MSYSDPEFWEKRFREHPQEVDWYIGWKEFKPYLDEHGPPQGLTCLVVGCGTSKLSSELTTQGWIVTNIDIARAALVHMYNDKEDFV